MSNFSSCTEIIFTDQPNLPIHSGIHPSLPSNCHLQITNCKFNLIINYPPPYNRQVWEYKNPDTTLIKKHLVKLTDICYLTKNISVINLKYLMIRLLIFFSNFVPDKMLTFDDRDTPWMNELKIKWKNGIYKNC